MDAEGDRERVLILDLVHREVCGTDGSTSRPRRTKDRIEGRKFLGRDWRKTSLKRQIKRFLNNQKDAKAYQCP